MGVASKYIQTENAIQFMTYYAYRPEFQDAGRRRSICGQNQRDMRLFGLIVPARSPAPSAKTIWQVDLSVSQIVFRLSFKQYLREASRTWGLSMCQLRQRFRSNEIAARLEQLGCFKGSRCQLNLVQRRFLNAITQDGVTDANLPNALLYMTQVIHALNPRNRAIVLVDEYDAPTSQAVQGGYFEMVCI